MSRAARVGIALGWLVAVAAGARAADGLMEFERAQRQKLAQERNRFMRLQGWLEAQEEVAARRKETLGRFAQAEGKDAGWLLLQGLQEIAQAQGLSITDLRPSQPKGGQAARPAGRGRKAGGPLYRVDARLEGGLEQVDRFLQELPQVLPGIRLENFQVVPQEGGRVQSVVRLEWAV